MHKIQSLNKYLVGAYATSPTLYNWNENLELEYLNFLKKSVLIGGLELPFWGTNLHPFDDEWLLSNLSPKWENVLTCVPGTMNFIKDDPYFGLSSVNRKSRLNAIKMYKRAFSSVKKIKNRLGEKSLKGIFITSAPLNNKSLRNATKEFLFESLAELISWDWGNTRIIVEHCDAFTEKNLIPKKGFLSLEEEIDAIKKVNHEFNSNIGVVINWGRSAIELRSADGPNQHSKLTTKNELLAGIMFSGTTPNNNNLYGSWSDLHMPPAPYKDYEYFEEESLMTYENIKETLMNCDLTLLEFIGVKLLAFPVNSSMEKRVGINENSLNLLNEIIGKIV